MALQDKKKQNKFEPKWDPKFCDRLIELLSEGYSVSAFCAEVKISRMTYYRWVQSIPDFQLAHRIANEACQQWWENVGRAGAVGKLKGFNAAAWIFTMKNRFQWGDKIDIEHSEKHKIESMTDKEIMEAVKKRLGAKSDRVPTIQ